MLLSPPRSFLDVNVSARTPGVQQQARWLSMLAEQNPLTGAFEVHLKLQVTQSAPDGTPLIAGKGIEPYTVPLVADNSAAVDETGGVRYLLVIDTLPAGTFSPGQAGRVVNVLTGENEEIPVGQTWLTWLHSKPETLLLQGDWFAGLMEKMGITPLLRSFMAQADQPPFSKFS